MWNRVLSVAVGALVMIAATTGAAEAQVGLAPVAIQVTPDEPVTRRGDVLTFRVTLSNISAGDLVRGGAGGGVGLSIDVPRGLTYRSGSGRVDLVSGQSAPLRDPDPADPAQLLLRAVDGDGQFLNLGQGQQLTFLYQLVAEPSAKPGSVLRHRVKLVRADGVDATDEAAARVRIEYDAELDLGVVVGKVFCDADGDGEQGPGEDGVGGVRIYADTGLVLGQRPRGPVAHPAPEGRQPPREARRGVAAARRDADDARQARDLHDPGPVAEGELRRHLPGAPADGTRRGEVRRDRGRAAAERGGRGADGAAAGRDDGRRPRGAVAGDRRAAAADAGADAHDRGHDAHPRGARAAARGQQALGGRAPSRS